MEEKRLANRPFLCGSEDDVASLAGIEGERPSSRRHTLDQSRSPDSFRFQRIGIEGEFARVTEACSISNMQLVTCL